jgi:tetratricopeptide (TPR) repeat protein
MLKLIISLSYRFVKSLMRICTSTCAVLCLTLPAATIAAEAPDKNKHFIAAVHVADKEGKHLATGTGIILSSDGIIVTDCGLISKWFAKAEHILIVETANGTLYPMEDLISGKCDYNLALFKIPGKNMQPVKLKHGQEIRAGKISMRSEIALKLLDKYETTIKKARQQSRSDSFIPIAPQQVAKQNAPTPLPQPLPEPKEEIKKPEEPQPQTAEDYFKLGASLETASKIKAAVEAYKNAVKLRPSYYEAYVNLGLLYYKTARYSEAEDAYNSALQIKKDDPSIYKKLGSVYIITEKYEQAKAILNEAARLWPNTPVIHYSLGLAYYLNGENGKAAEEYVTLKGMDKELAINLFEVLYK